MQSLLDQAQRVAPSAEIRRCRCSGRTRELAKRNPRAQAASVPIHDEGRDDGLIAPGRDAEEVDERDLAVGSLRSHVFSGAAGSLPMKASVEHFLTGEDLPVDVALVVVPDTPALLRKHRPDAQEERHRTRLKDAALRVHKRPPLALELKPLGLITSWLKTGSRLWSART